jgi:hypothetical protein
MVVLKLLVLVLVPQPNKLHQFQVLLIKPHPLTDHLMHHHQEVLGLKHIEFTKTLHFLILTTQQVH